MSNNKYPAIIFFTIVVIAFFIPVLYYPRLPVTVASHYNIKNEPDAWMNKQTLLLIHLGLIFFFAILFGGIAHFFRKLPASIINLPNKEYWLSEDKIEETFKIIKRFFYWFGSITIGFITIITQEVYITNISGKNKLTSNVWIYLAVLLCVTAFLIIKMISHFKRIDKSN